MRIAATLATAAPWHVDPGQHGQRAKGPLNPPLSRGRAQGEGQEFLKKFAGEWSVTKSFYPRTAASVRTEGRCAIRI